MSEEYGLFVPGWFPRWEGDPVGSFFRDQFDIIRGHRAAALVAPNIVGLGQAPPVACAGLRWPAELAGARPALRQPWKSFSGQWNGIFVKRLDALTRVRGYPSVVHLAGASTWIEPALIDRLHDVGVRVVSTEHQSQIMNAEGTAIGARVREVSARVDEVSAVSSELARHVQRLVQRDVGVLPNVLAASPHLPTEPPAGDTLQVITVCALRPVKRMDAIVRSIDAARGRGRVHLHVVGDGEGRPDLERLVADLRLTGSVTFHGEVPSRKVPEFLQLAHVYVNLSERETFGLGIAEALLMGVPVVCSDSGGPRDFVDSVAGIILDHSPSASNVAAALWQMAETDTVERRAMRRSTILESFGERAFLKRLDELWGGGADGMA